MRTHPRSTVILVSLSIFLLPVVNHLFANGGPFVVKYPNGDPAAKGVLARIDPDLKPAMETRLKVIQEDLSVIFQKDPISGPDNQQPPLAKVTAKYTIENPTDESITVDFGFPILRGIYTQPFSMMPSPDATVTLNNERIPCTIISNSAIYGIIRQRAQETIAKALEADAALKDLVIAVKGAQDDARTKARQALSDYMIQTKHWNVQDAALLAQYASLNVNPEEIRVYPADRSIEGAWSRDSQLNQLMMANLGPLAAIGEQKATQLFAQLALCFDADDAVGYEALFAAWGGDVQERALDMTTGKVRPREITVDDKEESSSRGDPAVYARVDYLDENAPISEAEKDACRTILKNLPVVFTFAPMNILHYQVTFTPNAIQELTVSYQQYAYKDTHDPASYQLAYVVHPASLWKDFGPIQLSVIVPEGIELSGCAKAGLETPSTLKSGSRYTGTVKEKTGEIYLAVHADSWNQKMNPSAAAVPAQPKSPVSVRQ